MQFPLPTRSFHSLLLAAGAVLMVGCTTEESPTTSGTELSAGRAPVGAETPPVGAQPTASASVAGPGAPPTLPGSSANGPKGGNGSGTTLPPGGTPGGGPPAPPPPRPPSNLGGAAATANPAAVAGAAGSTNPPTMGGAGGAGNAAPTAAAGGNDSPAPAAGVGGAAAPAEELKPPYKFVSGIAGKGPVSLVSRQGEILWQMDGGSEANDVALLPNGNICFAFKSGAREVTLNKETVWEYKVPDGGENHTCQPLPDGGFLIGETHDGGLAHLRELDATGNITKTITIQRDQGLNKHAQFRAVRKTPEGTYLATYRAENKAYEFSAEGEELREFACGMFLALRLPNGNTLISCGEGDTANAAGEAYRVIEVDPQDNIVWELTENGILDTTLYFVAGLQRLPNGNTILSNWAGHVDDMSQPQVIEVTPDKQVVWGIKDARLEKITSIHIAEPAAVVDGRWLR